MVGLQTLDLAIGVRVPASQPNKSSLRMLLPTSQSSHPAGLLPLTIIWPTTLVDADAYYV
jgi:hypothetical protein